MAAPGGSQNSKQKKKNVFKYLYCIKRTTVRILHIGVKEPPYESCTWRYYLNILYVFRPTCDFAWDPVSEKVDFNTEDISNVLGREKRCRLKEGSKNEVQSPPLECSPEKSVFTS